MHGESRFRIFNPDSLHKPMGYSHVAEVNAGKLVYISGQVALGKAGNLVGKDDFRAQVRQIFENLKTAVAAAGGGTAFLFSIVADRICLGWSGPSLSLGRSANLTPPLLPLSH